MLHSWTLDLITGREKDVGNFMIFICIHKTVWMYNHCHAGTVSLNHEDIKLWKMAIYQMFGADEWSVISLSHMTEQWILVIHLAQCFRYLMIQSTLVNLTHIKIKANRLQELRIQLHYFELSIFMFDSCQFVVKGGIKSLRFSWVIAIQL